MVVQSNKKSTVDFSHMRDFAVGCELLSIINDIFLILFTWS